MKSWIAVSVVLAGLPLGAWADSDATMAQCVQVAQKFSSSPRSMEIAELDQLKTCINQQQAAMPEAAQRRALPVMERKLARASLRDDL